MATHTMNKTIFSELQNELTERRAELIQLRDTLAQSWQALNTPESELEETASKHTQSRSVQQRSESTQAEIRKIDSALTRMAEGNYGRCDACQRSIQVQRLKILPWTRYCVQCAGMREHFDTGGIETPAVATGGGTMTDDEMQETVWDELQTDGRVETEELDIACEDGVVYLQGLLPSDAQRQILLEIIRDVLDVDEVDDSIRIDRQLWEGRERPPGAGTSGGESDAEVLAGETDGDVDPHTSLETGEPMAPPDELIPENPER